MITYIGYHNTTLEAVANIKENGFNPSDKKLDNFCTEWLGKGVYFFWDIEDAHNWCSKKTPTNRTVLSADITAKKEDVVDLVHSVDSIRNFRTFCDIIKARIKRNKNILQKIPTHYIEQAIKAMVKHKGTKIIIAGFDCQNGTVWPATPKWKEEFPIVVSQIQMCVKDDSCILNLQEVVKEVS